VPPSKRAREYARRRHDAWEQRQRQRAAARRRRTVVAASVVGALVLATAAGAIVLANRPAPEETDVANPFEDVAVYDAPPPPAEAEGRTWATTLSTSRGELTIELDGAAAPQAVASFLMLARDGFFDGSACHRLVVGSILQCGDPTGTGMGGPGYTFGPVENAPEDDVYPAGTVAMARQADDAETQGSQFFITLHDITIPADAAGGYTVLGHVTGGLDLLTEVEASGTVGGGAEGQPAVPVTIEGVVIS
jgi:peptidyl-prolyl cis-trans isomerase B (cyclophilin B)